MGVGVVRSRRGFRVVLHCEDRKFFVANTFHGSVVEIEVGDLQTPGAPGTPDVVSLHRKTVVLRGDEHPSGGELPHRMIAAPVAIRQLDRASPRRRAPGADGRGRCRRSGGRSSASSRMFGMAYPTAAGIAGTVGEEEPVGLQLAHRRRRRRGRNHRDPAARGRPASGRCCASCRSRRPRRAGRRSLPYQTLASRGPEARSSPSIEGESISCSVIAGVGSCPSAITPRMAPRSRMCRVSRRVSTPSMTGTRYSAQPVVEAPGRTPVRGPARQLAHHDAASPAGGRTPCLRGLTP